jgi:hypothetical protein
MDRRNAGPLKWLLLALLLLLAVSVMRAVFG